MEPMSAPKPNHGSGPVLNDGVDTNGANDHVVNIVTIFIALIVVSIDGNGRRDVSGGLLSHWNTVVASSSESQLSERSSQFRSE